ncbi:MAG TPA: type I-C CRISPR-associated protein Cas5 [Methanocellales archaeon]|nr:type I-C CRISPR-associated protein Cas5 [Methanocellales archaeon]
MDSKRIKIRVSGEYACFTRPDLKVERMTYPCMTPSAARGVLEAILRKPEFFWHIEEIWILSPIRFLSIRRNELEEKGQPNRPTIIEEKRVQRNSIILSRVDYLIIADIIVPEPTEKANSDKYLAMFVRRRDKGQCYHQPFFGCREFPVESFGKPHGDENSIPEDIPIGGMLLDIFYDENGKPRPVFFEAKITQGRLKCGDIYRNEMWKTSHLKRSVPVSYDSNLEKWNSQEEEELWKEGWPI